MGILPNLTLNAGIRWEQEKVRGLNGRHHINVNHFPRVRLVGSVSDRKTKVSAS